MRRLRTTLAALGLTLTLLGTSGCGSTTELAADRGHTLQASVLAVTRAAAEGDWREASTLLASTRALLDAGVEQGEVSAMRYRAIDAALDEVEAELAAAQQRASTAAATPAPDQTAPAVEATPTPAATTTPVVGKTAPSKPAPAQPAPPRKAEKPEKPKPGKAQPPHKGGDDKGKKKPGGPKP